MREDTRIKTPPRGTQLPWNQDTARKNAPILVHPRKEPQREASAQVKRHGARGRNTDHRCTASILPTTPRTRRFILRIAFQVMQAQSSLQHQAGPGDQSMPGQLRPRVGTFPERNGQHGGNMRPEASPTKPPTSSSHITSPINHSPQRVNPGSVRRASCDPRDDR